MSHGQTTLDAVTVPVWYDFASTLCYVTHRVMERMAPTLDEVGVQLHWQPLDLSQLLAPYRREQAVPEERRANAKRVAIDLGVDVDVPAIWLDSRSVAAAAIALAGSPHEATWRERVFTALFEERRSQVDDREVAHLSDELGWRIGDSELARGREALSAQTEVARDAMVSGVPTFMLGEWPVGGIQTEDTMTQLLRRFASKQREGAAK